MIQRSGVVFPPCPTTLKVCQHSQRTPDRDDVLMLSRWPWRVAAWLTDWLASHLAAWLSARPVPSHLAGQVTDKPAN